jgi:hypothetical protein
MSRSIIYLKGVDKNARKNSIKIDFSSKKGGVKVKCQLWSWR